MTASTVNFLTGFSHRRSHCLTISWSESQLRVGILNLEFTLYTACDCGW